MLISVISSWYLLKAGELKARPSLEIRRNHSLQFRKKTDPIRNIETQPCSADTNILNTFLIRSRYLFTSRPVVFFVTSAILRFISENGSLAHRADTIFVRTRRMWYISSVMSLFSLWLAKVIYPSWNVTHTTGIRSRHSDFSFRVVKNYTSLHPHITSKITAPGLPKPSPII